MSEGFIYSVTGNPFVDTGQAVIAYLAGKESFTQLTHADVKRVFDSGEELADWNSRFKSFTMVFGNNGPLYQPRDSKKNTEAENKHIRSERKKKYSRILSSLLSQIENPNPDMGICECCGEFVSTDLKAVYENIGDNTVKERSIGRDLFPLIGSLGSDAQALPSASRMFNICPRCLFAVSYIPLGTRLLNRQLIVFEGAHIPFIQELIASIVDENKLRLSASGDSIDIIGTKQSSGGTVKWLCTVFEMLQTAHKRKELPKNSELNIWLFTNSGTGASCDIMQIPCMSVQFLWDAGGYGLFNEIRSICDNEKNFISDSSSHLLNSIRIGADYVGLYPYKKFEGVSVDLFVFYQMYFFGIPHSTFVSSQKLARFILPDDPKERKEWMKSDVFNDAKKRNILKGKIAELVENGQLSIDDYFHIFPMESLNPLKMKFNGFKTITYFLFHLDDDIPTDYDHYNKLKDGEDMKMNPRIREAANLYFNDYVENRGLKRFKKDVLDEFKNGNINLSWLKYVFCTLSERYQGFGPNDWDDFWHDLCHDESGNYAGHELLFQMRLALSDLYRIKNQELIKL